MDQSEGCFFSSSLILHPSSFILYEEIIPMQLKGMSITVYEKHHTLLKKWAQEQDRSISAVLRRLIDKEEERRNKQQRVANQSLGQ
jgi:hypothetical protein